MPRRIHVLQIQWRHSDKVVGWKLYGAIEDGDHLRSFVKAGTAPRRVALQAQLVAVHRRTKQVRTIAAVPVVTSETSIAECGCVQGRRMLVHLGLLAVAILTDRYRVRSQQPGVLARMRAVAGSAFALCAGMLHLRRLNLLGLLLVAGNAQPTNVSLGEDNLAVFGVRMAGFTGARLERRVLEALRQLRLGGLVRIVAGQAVGGGKWLIVVRLGQLLVSGVVAVEAERRRILGQMKTVVALGGIPGLVRDVASITAHVECRVSAAFFRNIETLVVATQTQILLTVPACHLL